MITQLAHGIHSVPADVYHQRILGVVSKGALDEIAKTPAHYRAWVEGADQDETPALIFGRAYHCRILEPDVFAQTYIAETKHPFRRVSEAQRNAKKPSDETLRAIEYWDAWAKSSAGKIELSPDDSRRVEAMREAIVRHPIAGPLFTNGAAESVCVWEDRATGLLCKSRMDYWRSDLHVVADLKSTEDASQSGFARSVAGYRYHVQEAHYGAGIERVTGEPANFLFVAQEKRSPYAVAVYQLDRDAIELGRDVRARNMDTLNECLMKDTWPAYPPNITSLSMPAWAFKESTL